MAQTPVDDEATDPHVLNLEPEEKAQRIMCCPLCQSRRLYYSFTKQGYRVERCKDCTFMLLNPQPRDEELAAIYNAQYFLGSAQDRQRVSDMKAATARLYLRDLQRYRGSAHGRLLELGCGQGELLVEAQRLGYDVTGVEYSSSAAACAQQRLGPNGTVHCGELEKLPLPPASFDVCVLCDVIEHVRDPLAYLKHIHRLLKPGGTIYVATPSLDSWSAALLKEKWMEFKPEHLSYFDRNTMQGALFQAGFRGILTRPGWKILNLDYVADHFRRFRVPLFSTLLPWLTRFLPRRLCRWNVPIVASGIGVLAQAEAVPARRKLSVIVPVYNEAATCAELLRNLLRKQLADVDIEVIIVESNSTDGSREMVTRYQDHPRVRLVLEDRPRGKGHAIRAGFAHATGDYILIQDADLEYDLDDYDALVEPLVRGHAAFVLGSRHGGNVFKMRYFSSQWLLSTFLNMGHWFFAFLVNFLFRLRLRDPFTMFKVFRRDCLYGLTFTCNRFDFDFELVIKLARKGYRPVEIPVNYRSRSFREGKKVSVFRDPPLWLRTLLWLRFARVNPFREIAWQNEKRHDQGGTDVRQAA